MTKPLNENIQYVRIETEDGDLVPIMDAVKDELARIKDATGFPVVAGKP